MTLNDLLTQTKPDKNGCRLWTGTLSNGYGAATIDGTWWRLHRYVLILASGVDHPDLLALHCCPGGGRRACIEPEHLYWGTHGDNMRDSIADGAHRSPWAWTGTTCRKGHDLTVPGAIVPRWGGGRRCAECQRETKRRMNQRRRDRRAQRGPVAIRPNPPIKGHRLLHEGYRVRHLNPLTETYDGWEEGCECGEKPSMAGSVSINEMKRWHRRHKAELRDGQRKERSG